jgi:SAM-dependent methyltransferase
VFPETSQSQDWSVTVERWNEVLDLLARVVAPGPRLVVVDGGADRLAERLDDIGQSCRRLSDADPRADEDAWRSDPQPTTIAIADGATWRAWPPGRPWDVVIWLRTSTPVPVEPHPEREATIVVDLHDPTWPVIRHIDPTLADRGSWHRAETRAFFALRALTWDVKFGNDQPAYARAVAEIGIAPGDVVVDVGCGTGRALPALRDATGPGGVVIGIDITEEMLATARRHGRADLAHLVLGDAQHLPLPDGCVRAVFAAGLIGHLPAVEPGLTELARVTAPDGRLALFHPSGRAALAARHGRTLRPDEPLSEGELRETLRRCGWRLDTYDDPPHRFFALAIRDH